MPDFAVLGNEEALMQQKYLEAMYERHLGSHYSYQVIQLESVDLVNTGNEISNGGPTHKLLTRFMISAMVPLHFTA